jgi:catechol 2,3-dioxygenase-like lactoylglutathione lyase family enzyme
MLDHIGFAVRDLHRAKAFYEAALAPLGIGVILEFTAAQTGKNAHVGFGIENKPFFWIGSGPPLEGRFHVAFAAADRATVDAFHKAAIAAGGVDNGPPGIRAHYHPDYYGAFVTDPEGHNIEAVCHAPATRG